MCPYAPATTAVSRAAADVRAGAVSSLVVALLAACTASVGAVSASAAAAPPALCLPGWQGPSDLVFISYGSQSNLSPDDLVSYICYTDRHGEALPAPFFDGFVLTPTNETVAGWEDNLFRPGVLLDALDQAAATVKTEGVYPATQWLAVYLAIPNPTGRTAAERIARARWYVDTLRERFLARNYVHLRLFGFYWQREDLLDPDYRLDPVAEETLRSTANYVHSLTGVPPQEQPSLQLLWVPYDVGHVNRARLGDWEAGLLPMDGVWLQPNTLWATRPGYDAQDLDDTAQYALSRGASVEIEFDAGVSQTGWKATRYLHYLVSGLTYGYGRAALTYYEGGGGLSAMAKSPLPLLRQLYERTYAFARGHYAPGGLFLGGNWLGTDSEGYQSASWVSHLDDTLIPVGLWPEGTESPLSTSSLRLVEPDPNHSYWLLLRFGPPSSSPDGASQNPLNEPTQQLPTTHQAGSSRPTTPAEGVISIEPQDGTRVALGTYPLDGKVHSRWFSLPASVLQQGVDPVPEQRLGYRIRFSHPVTLYSAWVRADNWPFAWDQDSASFWAVVDPDALVAQEGHSIPGVWFDEVTQTVHWRGMDEARPLLVGVETPTNGLKAYLVTPQRIDSYGAGSIALAELDPRLPVGGPVTRVWVQPADQPFHTVFGGDGDTAATWRSPGVALTPGSAWSFEGKPVGVGRRLKPITSDGQRPPQGNAANVQSHEKAPARQGELTIRVPDVCGSRDGRGSSDEGGSPDVCSVPDGCGSRDEHGNPEAVWTLQVRFDPLRAPLRWQLVAESPPLPPGCSSSDVRGVQEVQGVREVQGVQGVREVREGVASPPVVTASGTLQPGDSLLEIQLPAAQSQAQLCGADAPALAFTGRTFKLLITGSGRLREAWLAFGPAQKAKTAGVEPPKLDKSEG